jgi:ubiquinone/menaquinone biosynthesis C-methylase UbiE
MDKNYYPEYYDLERSNWWFLARLQIIRSQVAAIANGRKTLKILNVGAGTGATSQMLQEFGNVISVEYNEDCVAYVNQRLNFNMVQGSILDLQYPDNYFDLVCAFDVIEHVEDDKLAVNEMFRVCKPQGNVFITVPAFMFLWSQHDVINHHYRRYTKKQLIEVVQRKPVQYCTFFNSILFLPIAAMRLLGKLIPFKRKGSGSDFGLINSRLLNALFYKLFIAENALLKRCISLPFGVSLLMRTQKT